MGCATCEVCKKPATYVVRDGTRPVCTKHWLEANLLGYHAFTITQVEDAK